MSTTKKLALMIVALYFSSFAQARELEVATGGATVTINGMTYTGKNISVDGNRVVVDGVCLLYTSPSPRDRTRSRMPSSA